MKSSNKVVVNTGILFLRMLCTMAISLYTTRQVLKVLGSTDYGIFNLIAGVIALLTFLNNAMATSTQRYLSYYQGKNDLVMQRKVFNNSMWSHIAIGLLIILFLEVAGLFFFDGFLNIPQNRVEAARSVYHYMTATIFFTILAVPFNGSLIAHENMLWVAVVNFAETVLKLGIAFALLFITTSDKLIQFGFLTASISVVSFMLYAFYCIRKYEECNFRDFKIIDQKLIKELTSFAGWNLFGSLCAVGRNQGIAILLNLFFGTVVNAAYGIANQITSQLLVLSSTIIRAINPQIMKSEGAGDRSRMLRLSMLASKLSFFLVAMLVVPLIVEIDNILLFWLGEVPENTTVFCSLLMLGILSNQLTIGLQSGLQASGKIKDYQIVVGTVLLLTLPFAYLLLKLGAPPYSVFISYIIMELIACILRVIFMKNKANLPIKTYMQRVIFKEIIPLLLLVILCNLWAYTLPNISFRFIFTALFSAPLFIISVYYFGLCKDESETVNAMFDGLKNKFASSLLKKI